MNNKWKHRLGSLLLSLALAVGLWAPALAAEDIAPPTREEAAQAAAQYAAQYGGATSIQYAVWESGKITLSGHAGVYSRTESQLLTGEELYGIGSISKVYTTAAVMKLVEAGKIKLDEHVVTYLPDFRMADERYKDITMRMLLNHSSGLMGSSTGSAFLFGDDDRTATKDLLNRLSTQRLKAAPGAFSVYCNDGFTLAELVVEAVSGKEFPDYLREELLAPVGLKNTFVPSDDVDDVRFAKTYLGTDTRALPQDTLGVVGTGGIYATAADLATFGGALTSSGLLSDASLTAMAAPEYKSGLWPEDDDDSIAYGLGWDSVKYFPFALSNIQALAKGGDTQLYHAGLVIIPEYDLAAAVVSSGGVSTYNEMAAAQMLMGALAQRGVSVDETVPTLPDAQPAAMPTKMTDYAGYYGSTMQQLEIGVSADGVLSLQSMNYPSTPAQAFSYYSDGSFRDGANTVLVKFVEEENGATYLYQKGWGVLPGLGLMGTSNYLAQKMPENTVAPEIQAVWNARSAMGFLPVSEKYTSQVYAMLSSLSVAEMPRLVPGYLGATRIVDENNTAYELRIPNMMGRDGQSARFYEENGVNYIDQGPITFADVSVAKNVYTGGGAYSTIQADGYARWHRVGENAAGKTMSVTVPENGGFYVYDASGAVVASSVMYGDTSAVLPEGGLLVFAGGAGARFHLKFSVSK